MFLWDDFVAKNNNELLANLGNFSNRLLKFVSSSFKGVVPAYGAKEQHAEDVEFSMTLIYILKKYFTAMEAVKLKDGLRAAMEYSSECNTYLQEQKPWELAKKDPARCA